MLAVVSIDESCAAPEGGAARAPVVVIPRIGNETASKPAAKIPHVVLDIIPPSLAGCLAASTSPAPVAFPTLLEFRGTGKPDLLSGEKW
jgi:hypothetical protein